MTLPPPVAYAAPAAAQPSTVPGPAVPGQLAPNDAETPIGTEAQTLAPIALLDPGPRPPRTLRLSIATWNVAAKAGRASGREQTATDPAAQPRVTWRHTFGAERRTAPVLMQATAHSNADIVALQGVSDFASISRGFIADRYRVIASQQLLTRATTTSTGIAVLRSDAPATTAVIYRYRPGLRGAGVRHFLPAERARGREEPAAITAFRLRAYTAAVWFASLDLPLDCPADMAGERCGQHAVTLSRFLAWAGRLARQKSSLILLGRWPAFVGDRLAAAGFEIAAPIAAHGACPGKGLANNPSGTAVAGEAGSSQGPAILLATAAADQSPPSLTATTAGNRTACVATADLLLQIGARR